MIRPKVFIGSSVEGLNIAYSVQQNLASDAEITVWDQNVFELSQTTIEALVPILNKSDFAIFVFSPDDFTRLRKTKFLTVRDNVIFKLGLFIGKLGRHRSFIIMPDKPVFHIPTDLLGIVAGKYDATRTDESYRSATAPVCHQIRTQVIKLGPLRVVRNDATAQEETSDHSNSAKTEEEYWGTYYSDKKYDKAIEVIEKNIEAVDADKKEELIYWKIYIEFKIDPQKAKFTLLEKFQNGPKTVYTYVATSKILLWKNELELALKIIDEGLAKFEKDEELMSLKIQYF